MDNKKETLQSLDIVLKIFSGFFLICFFAFGAYIFINGKYRDKMAVDKYIDVDQGFTISYPRGWVIEKTSAGNLLTFSFTNPAADIDGNNFGLAQMMLGIGKSDSSHFSLDGFKDTIKFQMEKAFADFEFVEEKKISISGIEAYSILAKEPPSYTSRIILLVEEKTKRQFFISARAFESKWNDYKDLFEKCLLSFEIPKNY